MLEWQSFTYKQVCQFSVFKSTIFIHSFYILCFVVKILPEGTEADVKPQQHLCQSGSFLLITKSQCWNSFKNKTVVYSLPEITPQDKPPQGIFWIGLSVLQSLKRDPYSVSLTAVSVIHQETASSPHSLETQVSVCPQRRDGCFLFSSVDYYYKMPVMTFCVTHF